jgi:hypothetical protein
MKKVIGVTNFPEHCFFNIPFSFACSYKICRVIYVCDAQLLCTRQKNLSRVFYQSKEKMLMGLTNRGMDPKYAAGYSNEVSTSERSDRLNAWLVC